MARTSADVPKLAIPRQLGIFQASRENFRPDARRIAGDDSEDRRRGHAQ
jgi:hypothetical protein